MSDMWELNFGFLWQSEGRTILGVLEEWVKRTEVRGWRGSGIDRKIGDFCMLVDCIFSREKRLIRNDRGFRVRLGKVLCAVESVVDGKVAVFDTTVGEFLRGRIEEVHLYEEISLADDGFYWNSE